MTGGAGRIGVIGGGLAGLAAACTLAARGHRVSLYEANSWLGGKAAVLERNGFRFDMGPTILTLPSVLRRIFEESGRRMEDFLDLVRLDPQWRCFFEDQSVLDLVEDVGAMSQSLARYAPASNASEGYQRFMALSSRLRNVSDRFYFWRPIGSVRDMFDARSSLQLSVLGDVLAMRMGRSVAGTVRSFVNDRRVAQMLDHFTQYVGSAPMLRRPSSAVSRRCRRAKGSGIRAAERGSAPRASVARARTRGRTSNGDGGSPDRFRGRTRARSCTGQRGVCRT